MYGRTLWPVALLACLLPACDEPVPAPPVQRGPDPQLGRRFDPATVGSVTGTVRWSGPVPEVERFRCIAEPLVDPFGAGPVRTWPNPNAPRIDPETRGLASAVVFLRGVDSARARPWDHPTAQVEVREKCFHIRQGNGDRPIGVVQAGAGIDLVSSDQVLHVVQARGTAFFALALAPQGAPRSRRLESPGVVELRSGSGYWWMRAYLIVLPHPYLAHPDEQGRFRLERVPPGEYDVVAWHPDWRVAQRERHPDLVRVQQVRFGPPREVVRRVRVAPGETCECELVLVPR